MTTETELLGEKYKTKTNIYRFENVYLGGYTLQTARREILVKCM